MEVRQFVDWAYDNFTKRNIPLTLKDLEYIAPFEEKLVLPQKLAEFLKEAKQQFAWRKKKQKRLSLWSGIAFWFIIALIVAFAASKLISYFNEQKVLRAMLHMHNSPVEAYEFSSEVYEKDKTPESYKVMMNSFMNILERMDRVDSLKRPNGRAWTDFTIYEHDVDFLQIGRPDSSVLIYTIDADSVYALRDSSGKAVYEMKLACIPDHLKVSNSGLDLIYFSPDSLLWFQNLKEQKLLHDLKGLPYYPLNVFDIAPDGSKLVFTHQDSLWKYQAGQLNAEFIPHRQDIGTLRCLRYSSENDLLAVGADSASLLYRMPWDTVFLFRDYENLSESIDAVVFSKNAYYLYNSCFYKYKPKKDSLYRIGMNVYMGSFRPKDEMRYDGFFQPIPDSVFFVENLDDRLFKITGLYHNGLMANERIFLSDLRSNRYKSRISEMSAQQFISKFVYEGERFLAEIEKKKWDYYVENLFISSYKGSDFSFGQSANYLYSFSCNKFQRIPISSGKTKDYLIYKLEYLQKLNDYSLEN